jgi:HemY protein
VARTLVLEAVKLAPTLVPAAALAGRLLSAAGDARRAGRIVETAWKDNPHPDLADAYAYLQPGDSARDRLRRVEALAQMTPGNIEGALAVARAALDAHEFAIARRALAPLAIVPTQRVAMLMAELEEREHGDEGRAREWVTRALHARRDPAWTADGYISDRWMPVAPHTGRLDAFVWRDPLAGSDAVGAFLEYDRDRRVAIEVSPPAAAPVMESKTPQPGPESNRATESVRVDALPAASATRDPTRTAAVVPIAPVIPLVHVPDDPGPEPEPQLQPESERPSDASSEGWRKLRGLFK